MKRLMAWAVGFVLIATTVPSLADDVVRATLANGLRVVIVPNRLAPVVSTELNYLAGSNDAPTGFPGTAHALEHMMFRGSEALDRDQLAEIGSLLGGIYNADTTETVTQYSYTVAAADLPVALRIEALRMRGLTISQTDWEQERGAIEQEVSQDLSSPFYTFMAQTRSLLFENTPYAHDALGTRPSFEQTDAALLRRFYETWYAPNNAILVIAGNVQADQTLSQVRAAFDDIPRRDVPQHAPIVTGPVQSKTLTLPTDFPVGLLAVAYRMPGLKNADFAAADILGDVLGSQRGALYGLVPAGKALMAQFSYQAKADVGFGLALAAYPGGDDPAPLLAEVRGAIASIVRDGVPEALVQAAIRREVAQIGFQANSIQGLAGNWSQALAFRDAVSPDDLTHAYEGVTAADVNRLARQLLDPEHAVTAILTPRRSGAPVAGSGFGGAESFASPPDHPVTLPSWAAAALATPHMPDPGEAPDVSVLPNGLRLIVQPEHVSHTVSVFGQVRQVIPMQEPPGKEGVAAVMRGLFNHGTEAHDRLAFQEAADDIAASINAGPGFSLRVLTPAFEQGMRLLAENLLHPAFPADAFAVLRAQVAQGVIGRRHAPNYLFQRAIVQGIVPNDDPMLREATPESVMALRLEDVRAYYEATMRPDLTTIVVLGDITPDQARQAVAKAFGDWRASGPTPAIDLPPTGPNPPSQAHVPDDSDLQESVSMAETVALPVTSPDRYALMLGNVILGGGFSSRLYRDLRVRTGYVYSVNSELDWSRTRCSYSVFFGADPQNLEKARTVVLNNIKEMQTTPVSEGELTRAKAELLRRLPMQRASIGAIAGQYLRLTDLDLPLDAQKHAEERYTGITAEQIRAAFAKWLRPDDLTFVVKGPL